MNLTTTPATRKTAHATEDRRNPRPATHFEDLSAALRAHAQGLYCTVAAVELMIGHRFWLGREDFIDSFVEVDVSPLDGTPVAFMDWEAAAAALETERLVCSDSQGQILRVAASLAEGVPVDLRSAVSGLDERNLALVAAAVLRAGGASGLEAVTDGWARSAMGQESR
jgi:hypothetical protein